MPTPADLHARAAALLTESADAVAQARFLAARATQEAARTLAGVGFANTAGTREVSVSTADMRDSRVGSGNAPGGPGQRRTGV